MKIIKKDLTDRIYSKYIRDYPSINPIRKQIFQIVVDLFLQTLTEELLEGNSVELRGFGVFERKLQKARFWAKDPRNGNYIDCFDHYKATFRQKSPDERNPRSKILKTIKNTIPPAGGCKNPDQKSGFFFISELAR